MRNSIVLCALLVAGVLVPGAALADNYGAIAYSQSTGSMGWSYDYASRRQAEDVALQNCRQHASDCHVPLWFRNACGAIAVGENGFGTGWGTDRGLAESYALDTCRKYTSACSVRRWVCTTR